MQKQVGMTLTSEGASRLATKVYQALADDNLLLEDDPLYGFESAYTMRPNNGIVSRVDLRRVGLFGWTAKVTLVPARVCYLTAKGGQIHWWPEGVDHDTMTAEGGYFATAIEAYRVVLEWCVKLEG